MAHGTGATDGFLVPCMVVKKALCGVWNPWEKHWCIGGLLGGFFKQLLQLRPKRSNTFARRFACSKTSFQEEEADDEAGALFSWLARNLTESWSGSSDAL